MSSHTNDDPEQASNDFEPLKLLQDMVASGQPLVHRYCTVLLQCDRAQNKCRGAEKVTVTHPSLKQRHGLPTVPLVGRNIHSTFNVTRQSLTLLPLLPSLTNPLPCNTALMSETEQSSIGLPGPETACGAKLDFCFRSSSFFPLFDSASFHRRSLHRNHFNSSRSRQLSVS